MASEITLSVSINFAKGSTDLTLTSNNLSIDVTGTMFVWHRQQIGTSEEALDLGGISTGGMFVCVNRDSTNFVSIRPGTGENDLVKLKAGEVGVFRIASAAPFAIADTAAVELEYLMIED